MKFIHLTDLHVTKPGRMLFGQSPNAVLQQAVATINATHADAELCVITGDIAHDGTAEEYAEARRILDGLSMPFAATVGNHDERDAARSALPEMLWTKDGFSQGVIKTTKAVFALLDTKTPGTHGGSFCVARASWLQDVLETHRAGPIHLFMHHPPFQTGLPAMDRIGMDAESAARLADAVHRSPSIKHMYFGHFHRPMSGTWNGVPFSSHRSMMLQCALDFQADGTVPGIFEEPQFAVVHIEDRFTRIHYHDFASAAATESLGPVESA